jgi:dihydropteroate synthase
MTKIIGILNYTKNSFSDGGEYNNIDDAMAKIEGLFQQGADLVDIGACATSYGAQLQTVDEEWGALNDLLKQISHLNISLDTYHYETMRRAIDLGITYINDVSGGKDSRILELITANPHVNYICMYSLVLPADKNVRVKSVDEIYDWARGKIDECKKYEIADERIIIDPGVGFVTNAEQSIEVIKNVDRLQKLGAKICIGHSRKSFFQAVTNYPPQERDIETLAASLYMLSKKVDNVRVHNVEMHKRAFKVFSSLLN